LKTAQNQKSQLLEIMKKKACGEPSPIHQPLISEPERTIAQIITYIDSGYDV